MKKVLCAGTAALLAVSLCGCKVRFGTNREPALDTVVARATSGENPEELSVTYEAFRQEYKYFLESNGIEDDTDETVAYTCTQQKMKIINYLVNEQIILRKAKEMDAFTLTDEEQEEVDKAAEERLALHIAYYGSLAEMELAEQNSSGEQSDDEVSAAESAPTLTDEEKEEIGKQKLDEMLEECGMTRDTLRWWMQSDKITEKLQAAVGETVERSAAEEEFKNVQKEAENYYNNNMMMYSQGGYDKIWLPDSARLIKHVLLAFDDDVRAEISSLRSEGKDDEADKKRSEAAEALKPKQEEVEKKLDDGEKIDDLIKEYSADASGSAAYPDGYIVYPNGVTYMEEFQEAAFVPKNIGDRTTCVTDYGVHIMEYAGKAKVSDEDVDAFTDYLHGQLKIKAFSDKMSEWLEEYAFEIDYETLGLEDPNKKESAETAATE